MRIYIFTFIFIVKFSFSSCNTTRTSNEELIVYNYSNNYKYEIELKYHTKGRGNIHSFSLSKYEFDQWDWMYLNSIHGRIDASNMIFTHYQRKTEYPWSQSKLKGYIEFNGDTANINLQMPHYNDSSIVDHWDEYEFNGKYKLTMKQVTAPLLEID
jgi:hypothetical protein